MSDLPAVQSIKIADILLSYSDLIDKTGLSTISANMANQYLEKYPRPQKAASHLISAFIPQIVLLGVPSSFPDTPDYTSVKKTAAAASVLLQILMSLSVAYIAGFEPSDHEVQVFIMSKSTIALAAKAFQPYAVEFGNHMAEHLIDSIPREAIDSINNAAGYRAVTKYGETGTINLSDWEWLGGLAAGAIVDLSSSTFIGWRTYHTFFKKLTPPDRAIHSSEIADVTSSESPTKSKTTHRQ